MVIELNALSLKWDKGSIPDDSGKKIFLIFF